MIVADRAGRCVELFASALLPRAFAANEIVLEVTPRLESRARTGCLSASPLMIRSHVKLS
jgi:hypothetical protein